MAGASGSLHAPRERLSLAAMVLEWIRRNGEDFEGYLKQFLFKDGDIAVH